MSFTSIPVLDLSLANDPATKPAFLADLRHALLEVGFLYLKNVGIPDEFFKQVISEGRSFFDIPTEEKYGVSHDLSKCRDILEAATCPGQTNTKHIGSRLR